MIVNIKAFVLLFFVSFSYLFARDPSTVITSDRMEMLRFKDHNEFIFDGNVCIKSINFSGSANRMWVYTVPLCKKSNSYINIKPWLYVFKKQNVERIQFSYILKPIEESGKASQVGQIKLIVATQDVFLETQDINSGEIRRANSNRAVIYPGEGKMILTENPVVYCSKQGTFRGGRITFFKSSDRVIVENPVQGNRSQVLLSE